MNLSIYIIILTLDLTASGAVGLLVPFKTKPPDVENKIGWFSVEIFFQ